MRRKKLFQKVMGITVTVILTSSTCISPILADDITDTPEVQAVSVEEDEAAAAGSGDMSIEDMLGLDSGETIDGIDLFTDGSDELNSGVDITVEDDDALSVEAASQAITIKEQPKNVFTKKGDKISFSVKAEGTGLTYQWQYRTSATGKWNNFAGGTSATLSKTAGAWDGWQVKCVIEDKEGNRLNSDIVKISFNKQLAIISQPKDVVTKKGDKIEFSVEAEGTGLTYQWQYRTSATGNWNNFSGGTSATLSKTAGAWDGWQVKCVIEDEEGNRLNSDIVNISFSKPLAIVSQPKSVTANKGDKISFTVGAEGTGLTYQWQYRTSATGKWNNFSGGTTATLSKTAGAWNGWQVKCVVKDKSGKSLDSSIVKITINKGLAIVSQPKSVTANKGDKISFTVGAEGTGLTYQWQYRTSATGKWNNFSGGTTATLSKTAGAWNGWQVKCVVKDKSGKSLNSSIVKITINKLPVIVKQPQNVTTEKGKRIQFSVEAEGTGLTYQWQYRSSATGKWNNFAAGTTATMQKVAGNWNGWQVRCVIKDKFGQSVATKAVTIKVTEQKLAITQQPTTVQTQLGKVAKFSVGVNKDDVTYQWETHGAYQSKFVAVKNATGSTYSVTANAKNKGQVYRCVITDANGNTVTSEEAVLNIQYQNPTATFVNASTKAIITTTEVKKFASTAGLPAGNVVYLPTEVASKTSYYTLENGKQVPVNLEAVVQGSSASYADLNLFFYVTDDVTVYVN